MKNDQFTHYSEVCLIVGMTYKEMFDTLLRASKDRSIIPVIGSDKIHKRVRKNIRRAMQARMDRDDIPYHLKPLKTLKDGILKFAWIEKVVAPEDMSDYLKMKALFDKNAEKGIYPKGIDYKHGVVANFRIYGKKGT